MVLVEDCWLLVRRSCSSPSPTPSHHAAPRKPRRVLSCARPILHADAPCSSSRPSGRRRDWTHEVCVSVRVRVCSASVLPSGRAGTVPSNHGMRQHADMGRMHGPILAGSPGQNSCSIPCIPSHNPIPAVKIRMARPQRPWPLPRQVPRYLGSLMRAYCSTLPPPWRCWYPPMTLAPHLAGIQVSLPTTITSPRSAGTGKLPHGVHLRRGLLRDAQCSTVHAFDLISCSSQLFPHLVSSSRRLPSARGCSPPSPLALAPSTDKMHLCCALFHAGLLRGGGTY